MEATVSSSRCCLEEEENHDKPQSGHLTFGKCGNVLANMCMGFSGVSFSAFLRKFVSFPNPVENQSRNRGESVIFLLELKRYYVLSTTLRVLRSLLANNSPRLNPT
jgi:hypothetical protein